MLKRDGLGPLGTWNKSKLCAIFHKEFVGRELE